MKTILKIIKGVLVGFISIIPGISGSLVATSLNIYEEIIDALSNLIKTPFKAIISVWEYFTGIIIGIALGVVFVATVFKNFPLQISFLFIGLIIGGLPSIIKENRKHVKWHHLITVLISSGIMLLSFLFKTPSASNPNMGLEQVKFGLIGFIIAAPIIVPGISGAMVLSSLGYYSSTMELIKTFLKNLVTFNFNELTYGMLPILMMAVGGIIGLVLFAKLIKYILKKYPIGFSVVIFGVLIISPVSILYSLNLDLKEVNSSLLEIMNTSNIVVSSLFLVFGFLIAYKSSILKYEQIHPAKVTNALRSSKYMLVDSIIIVVSYSIPILVFSIAGHNYNFPELIPSVATIIIAKIIFYYFSGLYRVINKHLDFKDLFKMFILIVITNIFVVITLTLPEMPKFMYKSAFLLISSIEISGFLIYRLLLKLIQEYKDLKGKTNSGVNTLIIGAGRAGELSLIEINQNKLLNNNVVGFLDDDPKKLGRTILGKPVIGDLSDINYLIGKHNVREVVFAISDSSINLYNKLIEEINDENIKVKKINVLEEYDENSLKDVNIIDLIDIEEFVIDEMEAFKTFSGKKVLITGASGSLGRKLINKLTRYKVDELIMIDSSENSMLELSIELEHLRRTNSIIKIKTYSILGNITNYNQMDEIFNKHKPNIVIHLAATRNVSLLEENVKEAIRTNVLGTKIISELCCKYNVSNTIILSSNESIKPKNVFGYTKKHAENIATYYNSKAKSNISIVRIGNILESEGSTLSIFKKQINYGGPVTVDNKNSKRNFLTINQAVNLIIESVKNQIGGETFILDMKEPLYMLDLAEKLISLHGYKPYTDIDIEIGKVKNYSSNSEKINYDDYIKTKTKNIYIEKHDFNQSNISITFDLLESFEKISDNEKLKEELKKGL